MKTTNWILVIIGAGIAYLLFAKKGSATTASQPKITVNTGTATTPDRTPSAKVDAFGNYIAIAAAAPSLIKTLTSGVKSFTDLFSSSVGDAADVSSVAADGVAGYGD
jgi:hypothetical protein